MVNYCNECGIELNDEDFYCKNCNTVLQEKPQTLTESQETEAFPDQSYNQFFEDTQKRSQRHKLIIIVSVIAAASLLVSVLFFSGILNINVEEEPPRYVKMNSGPKASFQSSSTGSISPIPEEDYYATYGYYYQNSRVGEATIQEMGLEIYQGTECYKTRTTGNLDISISGASVKFTFEGFEYRNVEDSMPIYSSINGKYSKPFKFTSLAENSWDHENGKMEMTTTSSLGQTTELTAYLPEEYWEIADLGENLEMGYSNELTYTMDLNDLYSDIEVTMTISVVGKEDITVPNGFYKDCYIIEIVQEYQVSGIDQIMTFTVWMDDEGITPQQKISIPSVSGNIDVLLKLDEYYTLIPPEELEGA